MGISRLVASVIEQHHDEKWLYLDKSYCSIYGECDDFLI